MRKIKGKYMEAIPIKKGNEKESLSVEKTKR